MVPEQSSQSDRVIRLSSEQAQKAEELSHEFIGVREDDVRAISEAAIDEFYEKYAGVDIEAALSVHAGDAQE